ncbi:hypothetical protein [Sphingobium baderi]|uniref:hypothetical protein n=1 Tax=Sphingobium baderi TaxID=1332080 RepID=UPI001E35BCE9|nr:hypothetical protein [Sphingobium baderi]
MSLLNAVTETGVDWIFSSERRAVTTMSSFAAEASSAGGVFSWARADAGSKYIADTINAARKSSPAFKNIVPPRGPSCAAIPFVNGQQIFADHPDVLK